MCRSVEIINFSKIEIPPHWCSFFVLSLSKDHVEPPKVGWVVLDCTRWPRAALEGVDLDEALTDLVLEGQGTLQIGNSG